MYIVNVPLKLCHKAKCEIKVPLIIIEYAGGKTSPHLQYTSSQCEKPPQLTNHKENTKKAQYEAWVGVLAQGTVGTRLTARFCDNLNQEHYQCKSKRKRGAASQAYCRSEPQESQGSSK